MNKESNMAEILMKKGYKEYPPSEFDHRGIEKCYQKRFDDEKGKKYFINVKQWAAWKHPHTGEIFPENYEYEVQLTAKEDKPINMLFFAGWTLEDVEEHMEFLFQTGKYEYYELFNED